MPRGFPNERQKRNYVIVTSLAMGERYMAQAVEVIGSGKLGPVIAETSTAFESRPTAIRSLRQLIPHDDFELVINKGQWLFL